MFRGIKNWIINAIGKAGISMMKKKSPILKEVFDNPDNLKIEIDIQHEEILVTIKKKD